MPTVCPVLHFPELVMPLPTPVRWVALSSDKRRLPLRVTGSGRIDFQPSVFQRPAIHSFILGNSALGIEASHLGSHSVWKGENIISFDTLAKRTLQRKKIPSSNAQSFSFSPSSIMHFIFSKKLGLINYSGGNYNPLVLLQSPSEELRVLYKHELISCPSSLAGRRQPLS